MDIQKKREAFDEWHYNQYLLENPNIDISNAKYIYDYAHKNVLVCQLRESHFTAWQAAKAQAVQSKQDLLDRVNARWQLAHEQCAENWNTYSSAQMDAFDWVEQDIKELLGEAQEQANDL